MLWTCHTIPPNGLPHGSLSFKPRYGRQQNDETPDPKQLKRTDVGLDRKHSDRSANTHQQPSSISSPRRVFCFWRLSGTLTLTMVSDKATTGPVSISIPLASRVSVLCVFFLFIHLKKNVFAFFTCFNQITSVNEHPVSLHLWALVLQDI